MNPAEKLNAFPGSIVPLMREIGSHDFFDKVNISLHRYKAYHISAKFLLFEENGITDISPKHIYDFFIKNKDLDGSSKVAKKVKKTLNYLSNVFEDETYELSRESWIVTVYLFISELLDRYVISGKEKNIYNFYIHFWDRIESVKQNENGTKKEMEFVYTIKAGTTSKSNISYRHNYILEMFIKKHYNLELLDSKRAFTEYEKAVLYRKNKGICQGCGIKVKLKDFQADHIFPHSRGGKTHISNGQVLCSKCNQRKGNR